MGDLVPAARKPFPGNIYCFSNLLTRKIRKSQLKRFFIPLSQSYLSTPHTMAQPNLEYSRSDLKHDQSEFKSTSDRI